MAQFINSGTAAAPGWNGVLAGGQKGTFLQIGLDDTASGIFKLQVNTSNTRVNLNDPQFLGPVQITIDPSVNGNINITPNGTGALNLTQGTLFVQNGQIGTTMGNVFIGDTENNQNPASLLFEKSRGGGIIQTNDITGQILFQGFDGAQYTTGALIRSAATGTIGLNRIPSDLEFWTVPNVFPYNPIQRMTISAAGNININAATSGTTLQVAGVYGNTVSSPQFVVVDSTGNFGSAAGGGGASTFDTDASPATVSGSTITIAGDSFATTTSGSGSTVTVALMTDPYISGTLETASSITIDTGSLNLPVSDGSGNGVIYSGGIPVAVWDTTLNNTFYGISSGAYGTITGTYNTGIGLTALNNATTASYNTAIGYALSQLTGGNNNCAFGYSAGYNYSGGAETNNICIGYNVVGVLGENNTIRIGNSSATATYITGISGVTVTGSAVLCSATGQLGTVASSRRYKDGIKDMGKDSHNLMGLRPVTFHYKSDPAKTKSYGLVAEEVQELMPSLVILDEEGKPESVKYHEMPAILLNELQKALKRIEELEKKLL